jgi:hypothetical protein
MRFYDLDIDVKNYAKRIIDAGYKCPADINSVSDFVKGLKTYNLWGNVIFWPLRANQNAGAGNIAYSLGKLGIYNATLTNGPIWTANGINFDGVDDYISTEFRTGLSEFSAFSISAKDIFSNTMIELAKDDEGSNREWDIFGELGGYNQAYVWNPTFRNNTGPAVTTTYKMLCLRASSSIFKFRRNNESDSPSTTGILTQGNANVTIGANSIGTNRFFKGIISASILFNLELSDSDTSSIYSLYKNTIGKGLNLP